MTIYPASALRTFALRAQNLHTANGSGPTPTPDTLYQVINQIGCVQIDTLQMVRRSQYLVSWSRMGSYEPNDFDNLIFGPERRLFEGWEHAATIIPLEEYRYQMPHQRNLREHPTNWYNRWLNELVQKDFVPVVLERVRREGALKVSNFESDGHKGGTWWNWRPAKVALEFLYAFGELMIADRVKFQRVYDLTERVLPKWVGTREPSIEERDRFWVERGAKALGVCLPRHAGDYTWMKVTKSRPIVDAMVKDGILLPVKGKLANDKTADLIIHRDNLPLLEQAADGALKAERTTFLSPFDNLFWAAQRDEMFWGFHKSLEAYLPAPKRVYGYFCLPILHKDRLVGRFDPKLERKSGTLILRALYLESGVKPGEELVKDTASAMRDFMVFHEAKELVIERSEPAAFGKKLLVAVTHEEEK
ncbi:MAG: winged helix DNA-binding domain-containing protein [Chloroflexi bacterium]|nr:winged helix DNA-binding domain-containing protein [Chloroflexota bacterium]